MIRTRVLIPTYNERENLLRLVPALFSVAPDVEVMVIDDSSPDGTGQAAQDLRVPFPRLSLFSRAEKNGLGRAYMDAFMRVLEDARVELVITMDADLSHDPAIIPQLREKAREADLVIGSRYVPGGRIVGWEQWRKFLSAAGNRYVRAVTRIPVHDCTSGYMAIRTSLLRQIDFSDFDTSGYAFLIYLKYKAWRYGARIAEIPICFRNRVTGESKISSSIIREGLRLPWRLLKKRALVPPGPSCPVCSASHARYWFRKIGHALFRCSACRLIFVYPIPPSRGLYGKEYFCGAVHGFGYPSYDEDKAADPGSFSAYLDHIERHSPSRGRLLDVGAATGAFVAAARSRGWDASGLEISDFAAGEGRQKGLEIRTGTLETVPFAPASFDVVTLWDVLEHVPEPVRTVEAIRAILKPGGLLALNTPDAGSVYAHLAGRWWPLIIPPEHLHLFRKENLRSLFFRHGFGWVADARVGKAYRPAYILQVLSSALRSAVFKRLSSWIARTPLNRFSIPLHLRDNLFVLARKIF